MILTLELTGDSSALRFSLCCWNNHILTPTATGPYGGKDIPTVLPPKPSDTIGNSSQDWRSSEFLDSEQICHRIRSWQKLS